MYKKIGKRSQKLPGKLGEYIFSHENPKASGALRWAPDPMPRYACFARLTLLCQQDWADQSSAPLDQILDLLLGGVWI